MGSVLVTGASGFIGAHLMGMLDAAGEDACGMYRSVPPGAARAIRGDLTDRSLSFGDNRFDCVFHLASPTPLERNAKKVRAVSLEGAKRLMEAARDRTKFMVCASGLGIYGTVNGTINESTPHNPDTSFARTRLEAQRYLEEECSRAGIRFAAVMFGDVYGPGGWFRDLMVGRMISGSYRMPGGGDYSKAFISVEDAAGSMMGIYQDGVRHTSYVAASPEIVTFREFSDYVAVRLGARKPKSVPTFAARLALGGDLVKLLCTPTTVSNDLIAGLYRFRHPRFRDGVQWALGRMDVS